MGKIILPIIIFILLINCYIDAPHINKNDPNNPFGMGNIEINVFSIDSMPIESVYVIINNDTLLTDYEGKINNYSTYLDTLHIKIEKDEYVDFEIDTNISIGQTIEFYVYLNYIPQIISAYIFTNRTIIEDIIDSNYYAINYRFKIKELDGINNIKDVYIRVNDTLFYLNYTKDSIDYIYYELKLEKNDYDNFFDLIGQNTAFIVIDSMEYKDSIYNQFAKRFVEYIPTINKPQKGESILLPDTFYWDLQSPPYYAYQILYIVSSMDDTILKTIQDIDIREYYVDMILKSEQYKFIIRVFDQFGNFSQYANYFFIP